MLTFKKKLASIVFVSLFAAATMVSCGKQTAQQEAPATEASDSTEHPSDSTEHPSDSTEHPAGEHPKDSTKN